VHEVSVVHRKSVIVIVMNTKFADNKNDRKRSDWEGGRALDLCLLELSAISAFEVGV
jgi:hypothetical protein